MITSQPVYFVWKVGLLWWQGAMKTDLVVTEVAKLYPAVRARLVNNYLLCTNL